MKDGLRTTLQGPVSARYVPTDCKPEEAPPGEIRSWPSLDALLADPDECWFPEPEPA